MNPGLKPSLKNSKGVYKYWVLVAAVVESTADALVSGNRAEICGFGSLSDKEHGAYTGRNSKTGEAIEVNPK